MTTIPTLRGSTCASWGGLVFLPLVLGLGAADALGPEMSEPAQARVFEVDARSLDLGAEVVERDVGCVAALPANDADEEAFAGDPLVGVWQRFEAHAEGDSVRFYYFHGDGNGLYRYGKVGLTNTHAFDYRVESGRVRLRFRKTGEEASMPFTITGDPERDGRSWLTLDGDPRDGEGRYFRDPRTAAESCELGDGRTTEGAPRGIGNRLWSEERSFTAGGMGFAMYQLQPQTIDGRGVGWFHRGDFDEWTTEALTYRRQGDTLTFHFMLRGESLSTPMSLASSSDDRGEETRTLELSDDPRNFWHRQRYLDRGPSFAAVEALGGGILPGLCAP